MRIISGATYEHYENQAELARRVPDLQTQLNAAEEQAARWQAQAADHEKQLHGQRELLQQILTELQALRGEPWPEGVFARYSSVGGSDIDLFWCERVPHWRCRGCPKTSVGAYTNPWGTPFRLEEIHEQAQDHAAQCRARSQPRPPTMPFASPPVLAEPTESAGTRPAPAPAGTGGERNRTA
ncbi:hypothetical protein ACWDBO_29990 [Streptomyces mirabilis]|uniref:hypothetical protein n=1 Tax=Streptomyces mirabilis TaxID=68239 RepID=UPI00332A5D4E